MNTPLLSICIPTFNNPGGVRDALTTLLAQATAAGITDQVEICIRDNSEDVRTKDIIEGFADSLISILYQQNEENVGYDRNVDRVLSMATGTFCWLLSDNELIDNNALTAIIDAIKHNPDVGHVIICPSHIPKSNMRTYSDFEEAITQNNYWIPGGLVSRNIFLREHLPKERSRYFGNYWMHLSIAFEMGKSHQVIFIPEQFKEDPHAIAAWAKNGTSFITYTNLLQIVQNLRPPYSKSFIRTLGGTMERGLPRHILSAKLYGLRATRENFLRLKDMLSKHPFLLALSAIALIIPVSFVSYAKRIKHRSHH